MLVTARRRAGESDGHRELAGADPTRSSNGSRRTGSSPTNGVASPEPFAVDVQRRDGVALVRPHGELDLATAETLRTALDDIENVGQLVLDLRGLSFIDSTGLNLLVALNQRAERDGIQLTLVAPAAPANKAIELMGLDQALPFVPARDPLTANEAVTAAADDDRPGERFETRTGAGTYGSSR